MSLCRVCRILDTPAPEPLPAGEEIAEPGTAFCSDVCQAAWGARPGSFNGDRRWIEVRLPADKPRRVLSQTPIGCLFEGGSNLLPALARVNNDLVDLYAPIKAPATISWVSRNTGPGQQALMRTLLFMVLRANAGLGTDRVLRLQHTLSQQYYLEFIDTRPVEVRQLRRLEEAMQALQAADLPVVVHDLPGPEAIELLEREGHLDSVAALSHRVPDAVRVHCLDGHWSWFLGPLLPRTRMAGPFRLEVHPPGFILRFPVFPDLDHIPPVADQSRLFGVFHEYRRWTTATRAPDLASLNDRIVEGEGSDLIKLQEALHEKRIAAVADQIATQRLARVVLVAGPSSAGKTTFTKRLALHLRINGLSLCRIELDNYFRTGDDGPRDEDGQLDFEHLHAIDVAFFNEQLLALISGQSIRLPRFHFQSRSRQFEPDATELRPDQILLLEGIHGLNDDLTPTVPSSMKFRIYVSALTHVNLDDHNRISTHDCRLLRRMLRDARERGYGATDTLRRWPSVVLGEERWIFPFQERADVMFNSALVYEMSVMAPHLLPLLREVPRSASEFAHAAYLIRLLELFVPLQAEEVPPTSLLREFIGGSSFR
ncbi:MAG TPA: nucleoside kinase [Candidatus Xenobia bacterium]